MSEKWPQTAPHPTAASRAYWPTTAAVTCEAAWHSGPVRVAARASPRKLATLVARRGGSRGSSRGHTDYIATLIADYYFLI